MSPQSPPQMAVNRIVTPNQPMTVVGVMINMDWLYAIHGDCRISISPLFKSTHIHKLQESYSTRRALKTQQERENESAESWRRMYDDVARRLSDRQIFRWLCALSELLSYRCDSISNAVGSERSHSSVCFVFVWCLILLESNWFFVNCVPYDKVKYHLAAADKHRQGEEKMAKHLLFTIVFVVLMHGLHSLVFEDCGECTRDK